MSQSQPMKDHEEKWKQIDRALGIKHVVYFARGGGIKRTGPFATELDAWNSMRGLDGDPIDGAIVWVEEVK